MIFGSKRNDVAWGFEKTHNEDLYNLYRSTNIIRLARTGTGEIHTRL